MRDVELSVGRRLKQRRRLLGLTQQAVGEACGISFQQIHKYECGSTRISAIMLWRIACILQVEINYFFSGLTPGAEHDDPLLASAAGGAGLQASI